MDQGMDLNARCSGEGASQKVSSDASHTANAPSFTSQWYQDKKRKIRGVRSAKKSNRMTPYPSHRVMGTGHRVPHTVTTFTEVRDPPIQPEALHNILDAYASGTEVHTDPVDDDACQPPKRTDSDYMKQRRSREEKWTYLRPLIAKVLVEEKGPKSYECCICGDEFSNIIRCSDCGPCAYFCSNHCDHQHKHIALHTPEEWKGSWVLYELPVTTWRRTKHEPRTSIGTCSIYPKPVTVLDYKGTAHCQWMEFCSCEDEALTIVRYGFWPSSPHSPVTAISIELLKMLRSLVFNAKVSLTAFVTSLKHLNEAQYKQDPTIHNAFTWDTVLSYTAVHHQVATLETICDVAPAENCPACPKDGKVISMDGNFSLVRRHRDGNHDGFNNRHPERFFYKQDPVDSHVKNYEETSEPDRDCSNFQAGKVLRSKSQNNKLQVKGVFGSVCRHDYPFKFFDLKHGERMAYPVYLYLKIKDQTRLLLYDIACRLNSHLKRRAMEIPDTLTFAVGIFHVHGHGLCCMVKYSPRRVCDAGLCDGEGTERLWSYLGAYSNITKEMTAENRHDLLTELLLHHSMKLTNKMIKSFLDKLKKTWKTVQETQSELQELKLLFSGTFNDEMIGEWNKEEIQSYSKDVQPVEPPLTWKGIYILLLHQYHRLRDADEEREESVDELKLERLEKKVQNIEKKHKMKRLDRNSLQYSTQLKLACTQKGKALLKVVRTEAIQYTHLKEMRDKYKGGQALGKKTQKQIQASSKRLNTSIKNLNECYNMTNLPQVTREAALKTDDDMYRVYMDIGDPIDPISGATKRKAVELLNHNHRAQEELILIRNDIIQFHKSVIERRSIIKARHDEIMNMDFVTRYDLGCVVALRNALKNTSDIQEELERRCKPALFQEQVPFMEYVKSIGKKKDEVEEVNYTETDPIDKGQDESDGDEENEDDTIEDDDWIGDPV